MRRALGGPFCREGERAPFLFVRCFFLELPVNYIPKGGAIMTRKDYRQLAEELRIEFGRLSTLAAEEGFRIAVGCIADAMKRENPRFDREKFAEAVFGRVAI